MSQSLKQQIIAEPSYRKAMMGFGWSIFSQNLFLYIMLSIVSVVIMGGYDYLQDIIRYDYSGSPLFSFVVALILLLLSLGINLFFIASIKHTLEEKNDLSGSIALTKQSYISYVGTLLLHIPVVILIYGGLYSVLVGLFAYGGFYIGLLPWNGGDAETPIQLIIMMMLVGGIILVVGLYYLIYQMFATFICVDKSDIRYFKAIRYSNAIVKGKFWTVLGYIVVIGLCAILLDYVYDLMMSNLVLTSVASWRYNTARSVVLTLVSGMFMVWSYILYTKLDHEHQTKHHQATE